jgi:hypothetical protein
MEEAIQFWKACGITIPKGKRLSDIQKKENELGITMPSEMRAFFLAVNGMSNYFPNDMDSNGFHFFPLEDLQRPKDRFGMETHPDLDDCIIFIDYLHASWWYGYLVGTTPEECMIVIIPDPMRYKVIATSLRQFWELYLEDSDTLYDYD